MSWKTSRQWSSQDLPIDIPYFLDTKSTTQRALAIDAKGFEIDLQKVGLGKAMNDECLSLKISPRSYVFIREVNLLLLATPVMFARLVVPYCAIETVFRPIKQLGQQSLGSFLFKLAGITREPFKINRLSVGEALYERVMQCHKTKPAQLWARRSIFRYKKASLLLTEVFLPEYSKIFNLAMGKS